MKQFVFGVAVGILGVVLIGGGGGYLWLTSSPAGSGTTKIHAPVGPVEVAPDLKAHGRVFERRVEQVRPGVYVAIGYGLANVVVVDAPGGLILFDTLESIDAAESLVPWLNDLRAKTGKDVTDLVYTHNHADHVFGAGVLLRDQSTRPRILAHEQTASRVHDVVNVLRPILFRRSMRQFGSFLPDEAFENCGIGPSLTFDGRTGIHFVEPTETIRDRADLLVAGERLLLQHAPGETPDQLMIHLPARGILLPADNYYHAFPNLYAIRGTPYRDVRRWVASLDRMIALNAEVLIPQHTQPVVGREAIRERLTDYRDAIQFVHDQTIRGINRGWTADEIASRLELPPHLARAPHLQEFYGRVDWSVRAIFSGTLGWFSGDPEDLTPVSKKRESELVARLAGGTDRLVTEIRTAMRGGEPEWALVLATHLKRLEHSAADELRAEALEALGAREISATGRNYFLTSAAEARGFELPESTTAGTPSEMFDGFPVENFLSSLQVRLKAEEVLDLETAFGFHFTDLDRRYTIRIRRGVAVIEQGLAGDRGATLIVDSKTFKRVLLRKVRAASAILSGEMRIDGGPAALQTFLSHFETP